MAHAFSPSTRKAEISEFEASLVFRVLELYRETPSQKRRGVGWTEGGKEEKLGVQSQFVLSNEFKSSLGCRKPCLKAKCKKQTTAIKQETISDVLGSFLLT